MYRKVIPFIALTVLILAIAAGGTVFALSRGSTEPAPSRLALAPSRSNVGSPKLMNFQGVLTDSNGARVNGQVQATFRVYPTETGGSPIFEETQTVDALDGLVSVLIGSVTPLDATTFSGEVRWLGIKVGSDPEMSPRLRIASVPFAFVADTASAADTATQAANANLLDGLDSTAFALASQTQPDTSAELGQALAAFHSRFISTTVDSTGDVGRYSSIATGTDGKPIISYRDSTNGGLKVAHCSDTACTSATFALLDTNAGSNTSMAVGDDGLPVISYNGSTDLYLAHCDNIECTSATITVVDSTSGVQRETSIAIMPLGRPVISYYDGGSSKEDLKVAVCNNVTCSSPTIITLDNTGDVGEYSSIAIGVLQRPVISYYDASNKGLKLARCNNAVCSNGATLTTVDGSTTGDGDRIGLFTSVAIGVDGNPIISYENDTKRDLKVVHCGDPGCSSGNTITTLDSVGQVGWDTSIAIGPNGLPVISYWDVLPNRDLKVASCTNIQCTSATITRVDWPGEVGQHSSMTIGSDGLPVISYYDGINKDLKVLHCNRPGCITTP